MIQQQTKLCLGTMKLVQWPTLARGVSKILWPSCLKGQTSILPYSCSSTMAQAQSPKSDENFPSDKEALPSDKEALPSNSATPKSGKETLPRSNQKLQVTTTILPSNKSKVVKVKGAMTVSKGKEIEAVMKVKSMSSAMEISADFNCRQRLDALKNLVVAQSRPLPLIHNLTQGISQSISDLNMKELSDLLFTLAKLSYVNEDVLSKTCDAVKTKLKTTTNAAVVGSSITSLRKLQWKDPDLLNEFSFWIQRNFQKFQSPSAFIYSLALLNHSPTNLEELLKIVLNDVSKKQYRSADLVNLVWSINALNCPSIQEQTKKMLINLFNQKFLDTLGSNPGVVPVWIKLLNLHAIAKSSWGQADLKIPEEIKSKIFSISRRNDKKAMVSEVSQFLFKDLDTNLYATDVSNHMGFSIDMVFSLDEKMNAIPVHLTSSKSTRIAVMIHSYHECCQPTKEPNGFRAFEMRLLEDEYTVVSVPYHLLQGGSAQIHEYFESVLGNIVRKRS